MLTQQLTGSMDLVDLHGCLSSLATKVEDARRRYPEDADTWISDFMSPFELDFNKLLGAKAVRRLGDKTQVVTANLNPHMRNRLAHSHEVAQVASFIAHILGLNVRLAESIALGHDMGHTPFGHLGEAVLSEITGRTFRHNVKGVVIAQHIEREGFGLNLTHHTLTGILHHSRGMGPLAASEKLFQEATVAMCADKIAYIWADFNDIFMRGLLPLSQYPELAACAEWFGPTQRDRIQKCVVGLCHESAEAGAVSFISSEIAERFAHMKKLMYTVYSRVNYEHCFGREPLRIIYNRLKQTIPDVDPAISFALLSDREALHVLTAPHWTEHHVADLSLAEILPHIRGRGIDYADPDLNW